MMISSEFCGSKLDARKDDLNLETSNEVSIPMCKYCIASSKTTSTTRVPVINESL